MLTWTATDMDKSSVGSSSSWRSVTDDVSVVVLTSATVDSPPGSAASDSALPLPPPLDGDRADVLPFRSTGGVSVRSCIQFLDDRTACIMTGYWHNTAVCPCVTLCILPVSIGVEG